MVRSLADRTFQLRFIRLGAHGKEVRVEEDGTVLSQRGDLYVRKKVTRAEESHRWAVGEVAGWRAR